MLHWAPWGAELTWGVGRAGGRVGGSFEAGDSATAFASVSPGGSVVAWPGFSGVYSLTPHTEVALTVQASLSGADIDMQEEASVATSLIAWHPAGERLGGVEMAEVARSMPGRQTPSASFDRKGELSIRFANRTPNEWDSTLVTINSIEVASAVPEPGHWGAARGGDGRPHGAAEGAQVESQVPPLEVGETAGFANEVWPAA